MWSDNDRSASQYAKRDRENWPHLMTRLESGGIDALLVWEPSRATRDRRVWAALAATCETRHVKIGCNGRMYDLDDPDDAFSLDLFFALATRESAATRKRVQRAVRANAATGRPHGKLLYGYLREYEPTPSGKPRFLRQVPDPETAPIVREVARRVLAGETPYAVAQDLNRRGIPTPRGAPRGWDLTQVKRLCVNPGYVGQRVHQGTVLPDVEAQWMPLVDERTFRGLVAKLNDPARRTQRDSAVKYLLSGIATCGDCGRPVRAMRNRGAHTYMCPAGFHVGRRITPVDSLVIAAAVQRLAKVDLVDVVAGSNDTEAQGALAEAKELRDYLTGFYDSASQPGGISPAALARIEASILPRIAEAERRAQTLTVDPLVSEVAGPDAQAEWDNLTLPQHRHLIRTLMSVRILPVGPGRRTFRPESVEITFRT